MEQVELAVQVVTQATQVQQAMQVIPVITVLPAMVVRAVLEVMLEREVSLGDNCVPEVVEWAAVLAGVTVLMVLAFLVAPVVLVVLRVVDQAVRVLMGSLVVRILFVVPVAEAVVVLV